jgi:hypothetical protein
MSKTDKDAPWWVSAKYYVPVHWQCDSEPADERRSWSGPRGHRPCDLPSAPQRRRRVSLGRIIRDPHCFWEAQWPTKAEKTRYRYTRSPSKGDRHDKWYSPERTRVRNWVTDARKQFNGYQDVEDDNAPVLQHRRGPYPGGWWD